MDVSGLNLAEDCLNLAFEGGAVRTVFEIRGLTLQTQHAIDRQLLVDRKNRSGVLTRDFLNTPLNSGIGKQPSGQGLHLGSGELGPLNR